MNEPNTAIEKELPQRNTDIHESCITSDQNFRKRNHDVVDDTQVNSVGSKKDTHNVSKNIPNDKVDIKFSTTTTKIKSSDEDFNKKAAKKKTKHKNKKHIPLQVISFRREIHTCCKNNDLHSAIQAYHKIKQSETEKLNPITTSVNTTNKEEEPKNKKQKIEATEKGLKLVEPQTFHNLIALCDGFADRSIHIGTPQCKSLSKKSTIDHPKIENKNDIIYQKQSKLSQESQKNLSSNNENMDNIKPTTISVSSQERRDFATVLQNDMSTLSISLNESSCTSLIRLYSKTHHVKEAQAVLDQALSSSLSRTIVPKIRMFTALLIAYEQLNDLQRILQLWETIQKLDLQLSEKEYAIIMKCATSVPDVHVMDKALTELAEEVLVPSRTTTQIIQNWFSPPSTSNNDGKTVLDISISTSLLHTVSLKPTLAPSVMKPFLRSSATIDSATTRTNNDNTTIILSNYEISSDCQIDTKTGILQNGCLAKSQLQPMPVSTEAQSLLLTMNETIVLSGKLKEHKSPYQGGRKGKKRLPEAVMIEKRVKQWSHYKQWLCDEVGPPVFDYKEDPQTTTQSLPTITTEKRPFDVVLDGANIGYFQTNFNGAPKHVDYHQINWVIQHFNKVDKKVLLILHERHFHPNLMPAYAEPIVKNWMEGTSHDNYIHHNSSDTNGGPTKHNKLVCLYQAPYGSNDDWFWFHAAIWCGEGTMVVTNDEMRDHFFQMLTHGMFLRWKERHQIHFSFGDWNVDDETEGTRREVLLDFPDIYSRRIQRVVVVTSDQEEKNTLDGNDANINANDSTLDANVTSIKDFGIVVPLPKRGDENRFLDGVRVANETEPIEETYVCIRPTNLQ